MDGVLINSEPLYLEAWKNIFDKLGISIDEEEFIQFAGIPTREAGIYYEKKYNIKEKGFFEKEQKKEYIKLAKCKLKIMDGATEFINKLKDRDIPIIIASSTNHDVINICLEITGLNKYFNKICSGQDVKKSKPEPDIFLLASEKLGINPDECLVIEDSLAGVKAGKKAGMKVWGYTSTFNKDKLIEAGADMTFDNFKKLDI